MAGGRFFAGGWASSALYAGAEPIVDAAGSAVLRPGWEIVVGGWAWVVV